jgi:hypothetical protein
VFPSLRCLFLPFYQDNNGDVQPASMEGPADNQNAQETPNVTGGVEPVEEILTVTGDAPSGHITPVIVNVQETTDISEEASQTIYIKDYIVNQVCSFAHNKYNPTPTSLLLPGP